MADGFETDPGTCACTLNPNVTASVMLESNRDERIHVFCEHFGLKETKTSQISPELVPNMVFSLLKNGHCALSKCLIMISNISLSLSLQNH